PVRFIEDRLENLRGGDMQGPDRFFDMQVAFDADGTIRAWKIRAVDDVGAYAGRAPFQLGKPITAICGPYKIPAVEYDATSVLTNKTPQDAVRSFVQTQARQGASLSDLVERITPEAIACHLYAAHLPDPDLIIRTSGEIRLS